MKWIYSTLISMTICLCCAVPAFALESNVEITSESFGLYDVNQVYADDSFVEYVSICLNDAKNFRIIDAYGNDVTKQEFQVIQEKYWQGDYDEIAQYIAYKNLIIAHKMCEDISLTGILSSSQRYSEEFRGYTLDTKYKKFMLSWSVTMSSTYNTNSAGTQIIKANIPSIGKLEGKLTNAGAHFTNDGAPRLSNVRTDNPQITSDRKKVYFSASIEIAAGVYDLDTIPFIGEELYFKPSASLKGEASVS